MRTKIILNILKNKQKNLTGCLRGTVSNCFAQKLYVFIGQQSKEGNTKLKCKY